MNHILYSTASDADKSPKIDADILGTLETGKRERERETKLAEREQTAIRNMHTR